MVVLVHYRYVLVEISRVSDASVLDMPFLEHIACHCKASNGQVTSGLFLVARHRAVLDLNTWLAAAVEDQETEETSHSRSRSSALEFEQDKYLDEGPSAPATMDIARLDLDPPGFTCKAFHDLAVRFWSRLTP